MKIFNVITDHLVKLYMANQGDSNLSPLRWDPVQKMDVEVKSIQRARQLDEINNELRNHIYEEDEYEKYLITQIKDYDNDIAQRQIPLIWNPKQNKYNEIDNLIDAIKLDTLNEMWKTMKKKKISIMSIIITYLKNMI